MIGILIPTLNRPDFVARALRYYESSDFQGTIYLADSSDTEQHMVNIGNVDRSDVRVCHKHYPKDKYPHDGACIKEILKAVDEPYCAFCGDDDFFVPETLLECAEFLEHNSDYASCHGMRANVFYKDGKPYGMMEGVFYSQGFELEQDEPIERWIDYIRSGISTQHYVHRTETWKKMYAYADKMKLRYLGPELMPCSLSVIEGKVKRIDGLHIVFQKDTPDRQMDFAKISVFDLLRLRQWYKSSKIFINELADILGSRRMVMREFWLHLINCLGAQYNQKYVKKTEFDMRELGRLLANLKTQGNPYYSHFRRVELACLTGG